MDGSDAASSTSHVGTEVLATASLVCRDSNLGEVVVVGSPRNLVERRAPRGTAFTPLDCGRLWKLR
jgi:hypothetical protein